MTLKLRPYQEECCDSIWNELAKPSASIVTNACVGSGKSVMLAFIAQRWYTEGKGRVLVITHVKELIQQDHDKLIYLLPGKVGIYSSGLNSWETDEPVIVASIQTVNARKPDLSGFSLVIIDEAHLIGSEDIGMYRTLLGTMPRSAFWGLTGTPWRLQSGPIYGPDRFFSRLVGYVGIKYLVENGFLTVPVTSVREFIKYDDIDLRGGDYVSEQQDEKLCLSESIKLATDAIIKHARGRSHVLIFTPGIESANKLSAILDSSAVVTGKTTQDIRSVTIDSFKNGKLRYLINVGVFTTGFDYPSIDCVILLRKTKSSSLLVQMVGRGLRVADGKLDCLVLDYAGNFREHPPIPMIMPPPPGSELQPAATKDLGVICANCERLNSASSTQCFECGHIWVKNSRELDFGEPTQIDLLYDGTISEKKYDIRKIDMDIAETLPDFLKKMNICNEKQWKLIPEIHKIARRWATLMNKCNSGYAIPLGTLFTTVEAFFPDPSHNHINILRDTSKSILTKSDKIFFIDTLEGEVSQSRILSEYRWILNDTSAFCDCVNWYTSMRKHIKANSNVSGNIRMYPSNSRLFKANVSFSYEGMIPKLSKAVSELKGYVMNSEKSNSVSLNLSLIITVINNEGIDDEHRNSLTEIVNSISRISSENDTV